MKNSNYFRSIDVSCAVDTAYKALTEDIGQWWTTPSKPFLKVGDSAKFAFPPGESFWTFQATLLEKNRRVQLKCVDALHIHEGQPKAIEKEWLGTVVTWDITKKEHTLTIHMEHDGLIPKLHCYGICEAGWDFFFVNSLSDYLNTGVGQPHKG